MTTVTNNSTDQDDNSTCANPQCNCAVQPGNKYCCDSCEKQLDGDVCLCGHSQCQRE